ncbi:murein L,D-transpeptidase catalytic domain family protein [Algoriphagus sp. oki45]|uniref:murein L,D-transpeptidase catalytic domain family protein n=1 Tax=Algoriphagus sp. oki45 TaxID=3067294 RepID=UPI0027FA4A5D|nr:murein L,D-transpeptidase catalytic domain family protein [Algoriphagus sp. oki45]
MSAFQGILLPLIWIFTTTPPIPPSPIPNSFEEKSKSEIIWDHLYDNYENIPSVEALDFALDGYENLENTLEKQVLTLIDFSLPSTEKRLWVIDLAKEKILLNTVVAHGRNSGMLMAEKFSNRPESYQSSLGFYKTGETYFGKHGYSLRLDGLEKGVNDQARNRAIVIHGADYAREEVAKMSGRLGRSLGCPAVPSELSKEVIDLIKDGSLLFIFADQEDYLSQSEYIQD